MSRFASLFVCTLVAIALPTLAAGAPARPGTGTNETAAARTSARRHAHAARTLPPSDRGHGTPAQLATITVRATALDAAIKAQQDLTPGDVSIVNGRSFRQRAVSNMAGALRYVPGVMIQSNTGGDDATLSIRGSNLSALGYDNSGVLLLQDGLPVTTADGNNHNRLLNPLSAHAVIVADGANALTYGASDLGGAIDFISRTARNSDPRQVYLLGGEHTLFNGQVSAGGVAGNWDGMLTIDGKHFSGYQQHSRENSTSARGNVGWQVSNNFKLRLFGTLLNSRQQLAGSLTRAEFDTNPRQADPSYLLGNHQLNVKTRRGAVKGTWNINADSRLTLGLSYGVESLYHPIVDVFNPAFPASARKEFFSLLIDTTQRTSDGTLRYHLTRGDHKLLAGINLAHTSNTGGNFENRAGRRGARTDDVNQHANNATLFLLDRWKFAPRWTLVYGTQGVVTSRNVIDVNLANSHVRDQKHTYSSINPRIGLLYAFNSTSEAFASASRVYEAPNNYDLNNDVHQNDTIQRAMQGIEYELGTRSTAPVPVGAGSWHWSLALYYAKIRNEILSVENPAEPGKMLSTNYPHTVHAGVEALVGGSLAVADTTVRIEPLVSATWNDFHFQHGPVFAGNWLPSAPRYIVHGQVMVHDLRTGLYAGPTFQWVGSRYADMANAYHVGGYFLVGLRAGIVRPGWNLFAEVRNLADKRYVNAVTVVTRANPNARVLNAGAPRSVFVGLRVRY